MSKILTLLALFAAVGSFSAPAFAEEEMIAPEASDIDAARPPHHPGRPGPRPPHYGYSCFARNAIGRTFVARGDWRMPRQWVQRRAVDECRYGSAFLLRRTCRPIGCR